MTSNAYKDWSLNCKCGCEYCDSLAITLAKQRLDKSRELQQAQVRAGEAEADRDFHSCRGDKLEAENTQMQTRLIAADHVMEEVDRMVKIGKLNSRSGIADRRLDYGEPFDYESISELEAENAKLREALDELYFSLAARYDIGFHRPQDRTRFIDAVIEARALTKEGEESKPVGIGSNADKHRPPVIKDCVLIGRNAGSDLIDATGVVIIGDDIRDLDPDNPNLIILIPGKLAIGKTVAGLSLEHGLKEAVRKYHCDNLGHPCIRLGYSNPTDTPGKERNLYIGPNAGKHLANDTPGAPLEGGHSNRCYGAHAMNDTTTGTGKAECLHTDYSIVDNPQGFGVIKECNACGKELP